MRRLMLFLPVVLAVILGAILYNGIGKDPSHLDSALVGRQVPDFHLPLLQQPDKMVGPEQLKGKTVLLNVWATWCPTCEMEYPYLMQLAKQGVYIVGVDYKDDPAKAKQWIEQRGNPYAYVIQDNKGTLGFDLGVYGAPETFLIDPKGIVRYRQVGALDSQAWKNKIKPLIDKIGQGG
ncbi:DsbE family thiol:disulfide interchange protein [Mangrovitalea sediminis]|uniref:DsbE family thiol:disulfide interchange protein n=1 Tax=Mangrovitalea sediminis TaxID=1982043 RepID=UPI000BE4F7DD|nr:DsbE family thiol:disulfide interchange protein [Mangrovitalea sediminis]